MKNIQFLLIAFSLVIFSNLKAQIVTDIDGNTYDTVSIGTQIWMAENLKVTHYPNGDTIPLVTDNTTWGNLADNNTDDAMCYYNNNSGNEADTYGALYTYAAAIANNWTKDNTVNQGVCPDGWHLPTSAEWDTLTTYLGTDAGSKLAGNEPLWTNDLLDQNTNFDETGFSALPGGYRHYTDGSFHSLSILGLLWSATESSNSAIVLDLSNNQSDVQIINDNKSAGLSVRCIKNTTETTCQVVNYPLNGDTVDISGNDYNGTFVGTPQLTEDRNYNPNSAYRFNRSSYMIYSQEADLGLSQKLSYSAWLNIDTLLNDTNIFTFVFDTINDATTMFAIGVVKSNSELIFAHDTAANNPEIINSGFTVNPHTNYHIVVLRNDFDKTYTLYVNNVKINDYQYTEPVMAITSTMQAIAINVGEPQKAINAIIDDVVISRCLMDSATIDSLYHIGGYTNNDNCQVVNWPLNGDSIDISGNNFNGEFFETNHQFTEDRFGNPNSAYLVDTGSILGHGVNYDLALQNSFSYSLWLNVDTLINDTSIVTFIAGDGMSDLSFALAIQNDSLFIAHNTIDSVVEINTTYKIEHNQFNHIVIIRDNDNKEYSLYVNNQLEAIYPYYANPIDTIYDTQGIMLSVPEPEMGFNGIIDDVIVYNCLIDSATIDSLYHIGSWNEVSIDSVDIVNAACGLLNGIGQVYVSGGSGIYSYLWSNGDTLSSTDNLSAGTNSIIVTDSVSGNTDTYYFNVNNTNAPTINISSSNNISCNGVNDGNIFTSVSGGTGTYVYNWSTGAHSTSISNLYAGTYNLTVIDDAGCISSETFTITQPDALELSFTTTNSDCGSSNGTATAIVTGGTPSYNYSWGTGGTGETINGLSAGAYDITVTDNNNCQVTSSAMVSDNGAPTITIDSITPGSCGVDGQAYVTIGNATSPTFEWNGVSVVNTDMLTGSADNYQTLTVHEGNCTAMEDIYIPYTLPEKQEICIVTVDSTTGANLIVWEKQIGLQHIAGYRVYRETSIPEEYVYIGMVQYDSLGVFVDDMAYPWIRSYKYKIAVIDDCGMISEMSEAHKTIHVNLNVGYLQNTVNLIWDNYEGFSYNSFNILRYDVGTGWNEVVGSPMPSNLHSITADVLGNTAMYAVTVDKPGNACLASKANGGPYSHSLSNLDDYGTGETYNNVISVNNNIEIYPNPTNSILNIKGDNIISIVITDIRGEIISKKQLNSNLYSIDMSTNAKGIYFIRISGKNYSVVKKFILR